MAIREIKEIIKGSAQIDGAGVRLVRVIGYSNIVDVDPFLMLDAFDSIDPTDYIKGFPWHPHRGIETITYLLHGEIEHGDNLGNIGIIRDGDCQWMTAGRSVIHQEMPKASERMLGVQVWLNLPAKDKMVPAKYHDINAEMIPIVRNEGSTVRIISGSYQETEGSIQGDYVKATFLDIEMDANTKWRMDTNPEETVFVYIIQGEGIFGEKQAHGVKQKHAIIFEQGEELLVRTENEKIRFLVLSGKPLKEPVAWGGPIVMNTKEELEQAFQEIQDGTFVKLN